MSITSVIRYIEALDTTSTTGVGKTGLAFGDITAKYVVKDGTLISLTTETITTLGTYQAPTSAAHIRIKELNSADPTKGIYEVHFHNTQVASSGVKLWLFLTATGAKFQPLEIDLTNISGRLPAALSAAGSLKADVQELLGTAWLTPATAGTPDVNMKLISGDSGAADNAESFFDGTGYAGTNNVIPTVTLVTTTTTLTNAPSDSSGVTSLLTRLTASRAGYLDNLNVGGPVASQADVQAINQSASKHILLQTVGQYERPESGTTTYTVEMRTFSALNGNAVNADSTPTISPVGSISGSLAVNLGVVSNAATGVYRATYSVTSGAVQEQIRFDGSATISSSTFTISCYTQVVDMVSVTWNSTDATHLTAIFNKLPTNNIADQTSVDDLPTNAELTTALAGSDDAVLASIAALNNLSTSQVKTQVDNALADYDGPTNAEMVARTLAVASYATAANQTTIITATDLVDDIKAKTDLIPTSPAAVGSAMTLANGAITDATITLPAETTGTPSTFLQLVMWLAGCFGWRKFVKDTNTNKLTQYMANGTTIKTESTFSSAAGIDTINKAS